MSNPITKSIDLARLRQSMVRVLGEIGEVVSDLNDVASLIPTSLSELINDAGYIKDTDNANFVWMTMSGSSVSTSVSFSMIVDLYSDQLIDHFGIALSENTALAFEISKIDQSNIEVHLYSIVGSRLYTVVLSAPNVGANMIGTLTQSTIGSGGVAVSAYLDEDGTLVFQNIDFSLPGILAVDSDGYLAVDSDGYLAVEGD